MDHAPGIERAFQLEPRESSYVLEEVTGEIPGFLRGSYYLNGPARFTRGELRYRHWLDGDGMVAALHFDGRRARFVNRFVRGAKYLAEEAAGRPVFRAFGTAFPSDRLRRGIATESPLNVSVYPYAGTLLAFGEQSLPCELDPETLETLGPFTFRGGLNEVSPFSAHPKPRPESGELVNFGINFSAEQPSVLVYRFDSDGNLLARTRAELDHPRSVHDFVVTSRHAVFYLSPYLLDVGALLQRGRTTMESLRWESELESRVLVVALDGGGQVASIPVGRRYCLHLINGFEQGERLTVDVVEYDRPLYDEYQPVPDLFRAVGEGQAVRFVIDLEAPSLLERRVLDAHCAPDFPSIEPGRAGLLYDDFWMIGISRAGRPGRKFFDRLVHARWSDGLLEVYQAPAGHYLGGEPVFANGVVLCQVFDAERASGAFAIFDAWSVARGPLATLRLKEPIPLGFHASFRHELGS